MVPTGEGRIRIKDIIGNSNPCLMAEGVRKNREVAAGEKVDLVIIGLERGPTGLECTFEEAMAAPHILKKVSSKIRETSLLYYPYWVVDIQRGGEQLRRAVDAIHGELSNKVVHHLEEEE